MAPSGRGAAPSITRSERAISIAPVAIGRCSDPGKNSRAARVGPVSSIRCPARSEQRATVVSAWNAPRFIAAGADRTSAMSFRTVRRRQGCAIASMAWRLISGPREPCCNAMALSGFCCDRDATIFFLARRVGWIACPTPVSKGWRGRARDGKNDYCILSRRINPEAVFNYINNCF